MSAGPSTAAPDNFEMWTLRGLIARHRLAAAVTGAALAVMLAMILVAVFGAKAGAVTDATTCTQWGSANQGKQTAYARLYLREHGSLPSGSNSPASVIAAVNTGCDQAYSDDVSDNATVLQAISGNF